MYVKKQTRPQISDNFRKASLEDDDPEAAFAEETLFDEEVSDAIDRMSGDLYDAAAREGADAWGIGAEDTSFSDRLSQHHIDQNIPIDAAFAEKIGVSLNDYFELLVGSRRPGAKLLKLLVHEFRLHGRVRSRFLKARNSGYGKILETSRNVESLKQAFEAAHDSSFPSKEATSDRLKEVMILKRDAFYATIGLSPEALYEGINGLPSGFGAYELRSEHFKGDFHWLPGQKDNVRDLLWAYRYELSFKDVDGAAEQPFISAFNNFMEALDNIASAQRITMEAIEASAREEWEETGRRPAAADGIIRYGPLKGVLTWGGIDEIFRYERYGITGYDSLPDFLNQKDISNRVEIRITLEDIEASAREECEETGRRPAAADGIIRYGPLKGVLTWGGINEIFRYERYGITGYDSLSDFLNQKQIRNIKYVYSKQAIQGFFTHQNVIQSAHLEYQIAKKIPDAKSGKIKYGRLATLHTTWGAVEWAIENKILFFRNVKASTLPQFFKEFDVFSDLVTLQNIEASVRSTLFYTGKRPTADDGLIIYGPLRNGILTWKAIDSRFALGSFKDCPACSLAEFMDFKNIYSRGFCLDLIEECARMTRDATGVRPSKEHGEIRYGAMANGENLWIMVDNAFRDKTRGLEDSRFDSLANFLDEKKIFSFYELHKAPLCMEDILASAIAEPRKPTKNSGLVTAGPLANGVLTWLAVDKAIRGGKRGLKDCGFESLSHYFKNINLDEKRVMVKRHGISGNNALKFAVT
jgi:hypothetical protein